MRVGDNSNPPNLTIVKMDGWERKMFYDDTNLPWVPPSPNIPDLETAILYPTGCVYMKPLMYLREEEQIIHSNK